MAFVIVWKMVAEGLQYELVEHAKITDLPAELKLPQGGPLCPRPSKDTKRVCNFISFFHLLATSVCNNEKYIKDMKVWVL